MLEKTYTVRVISKPATPGLVWVGQRRTEQTRGITRDALVAEAVRLLDDQGLDRLTMRKLGKALHVSAPTLYWHVHDREEVLDDLAYDSIFGELPTPDETNDGDWRPAAPPALGASRHGAPPPLVGAAPPRTAGRRTASSTRQAGGLVELLASAGLSGAGLEAALTLMTEFAVGATATSVQFKRWLDAPAADIEAVRSYVIDAAKPWPAWSAHINNHLVGSDPDLIREQTFDAAINALLTGVASLAHTSRTSTRNAQSTEEPNPKPREAPET